jgi:ATP-dependent Lon protease
LEKVKERIVEHLAVLKLNPEANAPILCFVGPPGVGKTSLGQSIARALGRNFERLSLGGMSDESELRGHRRTYIGAMPGRILQAIRRAEVQNPLIMLDEIDKLGRDFRGDPSAALLEILDPAQNSTFRDNYLNMPFDLSKVLFVATANSLDNVPQPLLDRMEVLRLSGYSDVEKMSIARQFLLPRRLRESGLADLHLEVSDAALRKMIRRYTREAGVRQLERVIGSLCRKIATKVASDESAPASIDVADISPMLGPEEFTDEVARTDLQPGVAAGLAWTAAGGDVLYVEAVALPDSKELMLTGQLGDVMKESAKTALSFIRSHWAELHIDKQALQNGVHLHVPAGATPKDGPSAGVTIATALASLYTFLPVRSDLAMTGEITLTGMVLPVGGVKEKVLAGHRAGMKHIILPARNEKDLAELPEMVKQDLEFVCVEHVLDALRYAIPQLESRLEHALSVG